MKTLIVLSSLIPLLGGCATFSDLYNWFGVTVPLNVEGTLLARESRGGQAKDEPMYVCSKKASCIVVKTDEFFRIQGEYDRLVKQLEQCQAK